MWQFKRLVLLVALVGCAEKDNSVDGLEECDSAIWYADVDGDEFGDFQTTVISCSQPENYPKVTRLHCVGTPLSHREFARCC